MTWKRSSSAFPTLVYYLAKILGLAPFTMKNKRLYVSHFLSNLIHPAVYLSIIAFMISMSFCEKCQPDSKTSWCSSQYTFSIRIIIEYTTVLIVIIVFRLKDKSIICFIEKLCEVNKELKNVSIEEDHNNIFKSFFMTTVFMNAAIGAVFVIPTFKNSWSISQIIITVINVLILNLIQWNMVLSFFLIMDLMRQHFACLNEKLSDVLRPPHHIELPNCTGWLVIIKETTQDSRTRREDLVVLQATIYKIEALHCKFCDIIGRVIDIFAAPILLLGINLFSTFYKSFDSRHTGVQSCKQTTAANNNFPIITEIWIPLIDMGAAICGSFIIVHISVTVCLQRNATEIILMNIWNEIKPAKLKNKLPRILGCIFCDGLLQFLMFSLQLYTNSRSVPAFGFFDPNYSYLCKIWGAVIAYLILTM